MKKSRKVPSGKERDVKYFFRFFVFSLIALVFSGCVVTQYKNNKGEECTRRYFTVLGIPISSCKAPVADAVPVASVPTEGTPIRIAPAAPSSSPRQSTPARTVEQSIRTTAQVSAK